MLIVAHHGVEALAPAALGVLVLSFHQLRAHVGAWRGRRAGRRSRGADGQVPPT